MAIDNTLLNPGTGGDTVRDLARQSGFAKTQVIQLDLGGPSANAEVLITAGQQVMAVSVPVVIASNQVAFPVTVSTAPVSSGTWSYDAGIAGTVVITAGKRILQISASAPAANSATLVINGGATITVPAGKTITVEPRGALVAPTLVFTATDGYFVEEVS